MHYVLIKVIMSQEVIRVDNISKFTKEIFQIMLVTRKGNRYYQMNGIVVLEEEK